MLTNAKVGTKLLALIVAPVVVLLAVASLGARDRLDEAGAAEQVETAAELTALTDAVVRSLGTERLLTVAQVAGGRSEGVDEARSETDEARARLRPALTSVALLGGFGDELDQVVDRLDGLDELRSSVDGGDADVEVVIDAYSVAIDELIRLEGEVATSTSAAELSLALADASVLSRAQEARSLLAAHGAAAIGAGEFEPGALKLFTDLRDEQDQFLALFLDGVSTAAATELRDALATPEVVAADAQLDELISDATMGGAGSPQIELDDWITGQSRWLETVGAVDQELVRNVSSAAADSAFSATKAARLFMIATAAATLLSILLAVWVARSIDRPLRRLTSAANELATDRLPRLVENLRSPDADTGDIEAFEPIEVLSSDEIGQMTEAFNAIQQVTVAVAEEQSMLLRKEIGDIFVNLARRNQSLLDRQIEFIDELESKEQDPDLLENLFRLDHLATRMRRNAESLLVLAGAEPARRRAKPVALVDVVRVAIGEVEDFTRVQLLDLDDAIVAGNLAVDLSHLLSELMENATHFSPPETAVEVGGRFGSDGAYVLTVADKGIGMSGDDLARANLLLVDPPLVGLALGRSLGFIVVGHIAVRLGLRVHLDASPAGGVTAVIALPSDLVARPDEPEPRDPLLDRSPAAAPALVETVPAPTDRPDDLPAAAEPEPVSPAWPLLSDDPTADTAAGPGDDPSADTQAMPETTPSVPESGDHGREPPVPLSGTAPLPSRRAEPAQPTGQLSEALPEGDEFEQGLASLIGPEAGDEDVEHQFWGSLADEDQPQPLVPDPAPDSSDSEMPGRTPEPEVGSNGLVRRVPGAGATPAPLTSPSVNAPRRSPEEVRAMLSRYRDGRKGRQAPGAPPDDDSNPEEV
jgi:signal transduction histidine kinase